MSIRLITHPNAKCEMANALQAREGEIRESFTCLLPSDPSYLTFCMSTVPAVFQDSHNVEFSYSLVQIILTA